MNTGRNIIPLIPVPDPDDLGEQMRQCTKGERAWVIAKIETGESNAECARLAGYSASSPDVLKSIGYAIAHRERVQAALLEMSRKLMRTEGPKSIKTLVEIRDNTKAENKDRIKASIELLNRAGMSAVQESHLTVTHQLNESQMDQRILQLAAELGLDQDTARKMLIAPADLEKNANVIDADFTEVREPSQDRKNVAERETRARRRDMTPEEIAQDKQRIRAEKAARAKAKYAAAQGEQTDLEDFLENGREGIEDLL